MEYNRPPWEQAPVAPAADPAPTGPSRSGRVARRTMAVAAAATAVVIAGWLGVAVADNTTTSNPPAAGATATQPPGPPPGAPGPKGFGMGHRGGPDGPGGPGGPKGAIHGQFTVPNGAGGYRTLDTQRGTVTAVSQSSITVKSDDGFEKKYAVTTNTLVNAGRDGIGSVKSGDKVDVQAVDNGAGKDPEAMQIHDQTTTQAIHDHWAPPTTTSTTAKP